jgi:hypothetical protein
MRALFVAAAAAFQCGCAHVTRDTPDVQLIDRAGVDVASEPVERRTTYFKNHGSVERYCRAPAPDFTATMSEGVSVGVGLGGRGVAEDKTRGAIALGGRNPEVLLARELLYRACELSMNINASPAETRAIYERFLQSIETMARYETASGTASDVATPADARLSPPAPSSTTSGDAGTSSTDTSTSSTDASSTSALLPYAPPAAATQ